MARPKKEGLDYFPHDVDATTDPKLEPAIMMYGSAAYAFYFVHLEYCYRSPDLSIDISASEMGAEMRSVIKKKLHISDEEYELILQSLLRHGAFDTEYYKNTGKLTSSGIHKRAGKVFEKRGKEAVRYAGKVSGAENSPEMPESKAKQSKEEQRKENKNIDTCCCNNVQSQEVSPEKEAVSKVMNYYFDKINAAPSSASCEELLCYIPSLSADVVIKAMSIAVDENKRQWSYIRAILQNWSSLGVKSLDDVQRVQNDRDVAKAEKRDFQAGKGKADKSPKYVTAANYNPPTGRDDSKLMRELLDKQKQNTQSEGSNNG